jgi:cytochrome bd-type quinol oxidase subunit 2
VLFLALAVAEATREKFVVAGGLLAVAVATAVWAVSLARPTRAPREREDRMVAHPVWWAVIYLVTIGPATFYVTYDTAFDKDLPLTLAVSVVVPLVVFAVRLLIVGRNTPD